MSIHLLYLKTGSLALFEIEKLNLKYGWGQWMVGYMCCQPVPLLHSSVLPGLLGGRLSVWAMEFIDFWLSSACSVCSGMAQRPKQHRAQPSVSLLPGPEIDPSEHFPALALMGLHYHTVILNGCRENQRWVLQLACKIHTFKGPNKAKAFSLLVSVFYN